MSCCMWLYKVRPDVTYLGHYEDMLSESDYEPDENGVLPVDRIRESLGLPMNCSLQEFIEWQNKMLINSWSDKSEIRDTINLTTIKARYGNLRGKKSTMDKLKDFHTIEYQTAYGTQKVIPVDIIQYAQGWFFRKSFLDRKVSLYIGTTKKQMETFFHKYLKYNDKVHNVYEITRNFLDSWEDGMIFMCSF